MGKDYPFFLGNKAIQPNADLQVLDKYTGDLAARVAVAGKDELDQALDLAYRCREAARRLSAYDRKHVLQQCVQQIRGRSDELAELLCIEAGKPIKDSQGEVTRLIETFELASEEATRISGEVLPMDITPRSRGYSGFVKRFPIGVCGFITPFNFPLNLVAHKVAPAIAAGCPFVLKPASATPLGALVIGEILSGLELPDGFFSILPLRSDCYDPFVRDNRFSFLSFTGSAEVGWAIKSNAGKKKVSLELGGNAACILDDGTDVQDAVSRVIIGAFYQSGQSCISIQRLMVHHTIYELVKAELVSKTAALSVGDPKRPETFIGPVISQKEAVRITSWIESAVEDGASLLCGGRRDGAVISPAVLEHVPDSSPLFCEEVFGPVVILESFTDFDVALDRVNQSRFGLQAGVFTHNLRHAHRAWETLDVGGVVIGDIPSMRVDHMPYGGVKDSGLGREGVRYAIEEMTEPKLMVLKEV